MADAFNDPLPDDWYGPIFPAPRQKKILTLPNSSEFAIDVSGFKLLPLTIGHIELYKSLARHHNDLV